MSEEPRRFYAQATETTAPPYYTMPDGTDLYARWRQQYGAYATTEHLLMSAQEYLTRCLTKGDYRRDLLKAQAIVARLLAWYATDQAPPTPALPPQEEAALAEQLRQLGWTVYRTHNGEVVAPPPPVPGRNNVPTQEVAAHGDWTVFQHCVGQEQKRLGRSCTSEELVALNEELQQYGIPPHGQYLDHAPALARRMPTRFPMFEEDAHAH